MTALIAFACGALCAALVVGCLLLAAHEGAGAWDAEAVREYDRETERVMREMGM